MPSSTWKDALNLLTGFAWGQMLLYAVPVRCGWHRQVTAITPRPAASGNMKADLMRGWLHLAVPFPYKPGPSQIHPY